MVDVTVGRVEVEVVVEMTTAALGPLFASAIVEEGMSEDCLALFIRTPAVVAHATITRPPATRPMICFLLSFEVVDFIYGGFDGR